MAVALLKLLIRAKNEQTSKIEPKCSTGSQFVANLLIISLNYNIINSQSQLL